MQGLEPADRIRKAIGVKRVGPPGVALPVLPVLHDVVERDGAAAVFFNDIETLLRGLVALSRLPKTERPLRHQRSLAGQLAESGNDPVQRRAINEVIIFAVGNLGP